MIGKLTGIVDSIDDDFLILDVNGVGYLVSCLKSNLAKIKLGEKIHLLIEMIVKEDQISLYGFSNTTERSWFKILQTIQGVGAKMAITILGSLTSDQLIAAILSEDYNSFKRITGIGPKIASRIVNELKNKENITSLSDSSKYLTRSQVKDHADKGNNNIMDALSALSNLGFNRSDTYKILTEISSANENISLEQLIKQGLAKLSHK
jgi:Holliday junction DNA helicase RuvA